jgi:hypothetical protein
MFNASAEDVKRLMAQVDAETNLKKNSSQTTWPRNNSASLRSKTGQVFSLRSTLVNSLVNHDPEWAMRFLQETGQIFTNEGLAKRVERENKRLETRIIRKIAEKDVTKAIELGREKLSKGVSSEVISLLSQIYSKDKEKGAAFAKDVLQKLKSSTLKNNNTWIVVRLFQNGLAATKSEENPLFSQSAMSELADILATEVTKQNSRYRSLSSEVMTGLEKYSANSAAHVKRTFEQRTSARNARSGNGSGNSSRSSRQKIWENRSKFQRELAEGLNKLNDENLSSEEKQRIINEAKVKILSVDDNNYRFQSLVSLAIRTATAQEKDLAGEILDEAETYINQDLKDKTDFSNNRSLANAYALIDADKSFSILENMVYRLNSVINGYIKFMEFSGNSRVVENDELIMNSRSRQFTSYIRFSPQALKVLAESDYNRLKDLSDKFERPEIRVETRLLIAKALLNATVPKDQKRNLVKGNLIALNSNGLFEQD